MKPDSVWGNGKGFLPRRQDNPCLITTKIRLEDIRSQDVKLMKQLLAINSVITSITNLRTRNPISRSATFSCSGKNCPTVKYTKKRACDDVICNLKNPLVRYGSEPLVIDDDINKAGSQESVSDLNAESAPAFPLSLSFSGRGSYITHELSNWGGRYGRRKVSPDCYEKYETVETVKDSKKLQLVS